MSGPAIDPRTLIPDDEVFIRMNRAERWQHGLLAGSFIVLILTGLPVLSGEIGVLHLIAGGAGAFALRGILHRAAAVVLIADLAWHFLYTVFTPRGRQNFRDRKMRGKDVKDGLAVFGRRFRRPEFGRYDFAEKFEYWSLIWGSTVMIVTGFFMWGPGLSLKLFPLWLHQVFVVIHGYEAILAFVAILVWHMYTVHLNPEVFPMSRVWLDGGMTGADMRRFHPLEYRRILEERERLFRELLSLDPGLGDAGTDPGRTSTP